MSSEIKEREPIRLDMSLQDLLFTMSEGNPGALRVLMELLKNDLLLGPMQIIALDDMNIRGTQIWIGFKDYCGEDIDKFATCIAQRTQQMVDCINAEGVKGNHREKAVHGGASNPGARELLS